MEVREKTEGMVVVGGCVERVSLEVVDSRSLNPTTPGLASNAHDQLEPAVLRNVHETYAPSLSWLIAFAPEYVGFHQFNSNVSWCKMFTRVV